VCCFHFPPRRILTNPWPCLAVPDPPGSEGLPTQHDPRCAFQENPTNRLVLASCNCCLGLGWSGLVCHPGQSPGHFFILPDALPHSCTPSCTPSAVLRHPFAHGHQHFYSFPSYHPMALVHSSIRLFPPSHVTLLFLLPLCVSFQKGSTRPAPRSFAQRMGFPPLAYRSGLN
jgi:hypothetical protein